MTVIAQPRTDSHRDPLCTSRTQAGEKYSHPKGAGNSRCAFSQNRMMFQNQNTASFRIPETTPGFRPAEGYSPAGHVTTNSRTSCKAYDRKYVNQRIGKCRHSQAFELRTWVNIEKLTMLKRRPKKEASVRQVAPLGNPLQVQVSACAVARTRVRRKAYSSHPEPNTPFSLLGRWMLI